MRKPSSIEQNETSVRTDIPTAARREHHFTSWCVHPSLCICLSFHHPSIHSQPVGVLTRPGHGRANARPRRNLRVRRRYARAIPPVLPRRAESIEEEEEEEHQPRKHRNWGSGRAEREGESRLADKWVLCVESTERAPPLNLRLPVLQPRQLGQREAGEEGRRRRAALQSLLAAFPVRHQLCVWPPLPSPLPSARRGGENGVAASPCVARVRG